MYHYSLYVSAGFGHIKPANALVEQFAKKGIQGESWDIFSPTGEQTNQESNFYNLISRSRFFAPIWNLLTRHDFLPANLFLPLHELELLTNRHTIKKIRSFADKHKDLLLTTTHPTAALLTAKAFPEKTVFLFVTDIHPHGLWKLRLPNIHYLVPMEETKIDLTRYRIPADRITITSFPIHNEIIHNQQKRLRHRIDVLRKKNPKRIDVLVVSGGAGTGQSEMLNLIKNFTVPAMAQQVRLTFLVSTESLEKRLIDYCLEIHSKKHQIFVKRYTPHSLYEALKKAEILITKAGGDITFEALAEGIPVYTLKDIGDHERLNRQYLELIGASKPLFYTKAPWDLIQSDIFTGEAVLMAKAASQNGKVHRLSNLTKTILEITKKLPVPPSKPVPLLGQ